MLLHNQGQSYNWVMYRMVRTLQEVKLGYGWTLFLSPSDDRLRAGGSQCDTLSAHQRLKVQVLLHTCECCTHQPVFPFHRFAGNVLLARSDRVFSGEGAKGVSMMQHGHMILLQLEAMNHASV